MITFDGLAKSITIPNINGYFNNSYHYLETRFVITIWLPNDANDSVMTSGKTKWEGHIYLLDGSVSANNFSPSTHYTITNDSGKTVLLNGFNKVIDLASLSAEDFSKVVVDFSCHSIDNSDQYGNILSNSSERKLKVENTTLAINKGKEENTFIFLYKDSYSKSIKIDIFDINGKRIFSDIFKNEEIGVIRKEFYLICSSTVIFVRVETEDKKVYYKKFSNQ